MKQKYNIQLVAFLVLSNFLFACQREFDNLADPAIPFPEPSELAISRVNESALALQWEYEHIGEEGFKVEQNNTKNNSWESLRDPIPYNNTGQYKVEITNLPPGKYKFRVFGYFKQRNGEYIDKEWTQLDNPTISISGNKTFVPVSDTITKVRLSTTETLHKEKGVCWSLGTKEATLKDNYLKMSSDSISISKLNLVPSQMYYIRTYLTNYIDTVYSKEYASMRTEQDVPFPVTMPPKDITNSSVRLGGDATFDGGYPILECGICYGTDSTTNQTVKCPNIAVYDTLISNLSGNTTYYVKAYAINEKGTGCGEIISFTTLPTDLPKVETGIISNVSYKSATCTGNVITDEGAPIIECGICYSTNPVPTTDDFTVKATPGIGSFTVNLTGLTDNTVYYIRAFAINEGGTGYGDEVKSFKTIEIILPKVETGAISDILYNTVTCTGNVVDGGGGAVTECGICYSKNPVPTTADFKVSATPGIGSFSVTLKELTANTDYYVRAFAVNEKGPGYGEIKSFKTLPPVAPTVQTLSVSDRGSRSAKINAIISNNGGAAIIESGICWGTSNNPTVEQNMGMTTNGPTAIGNFTHSAIGLTQDTEYYVRAYAKNQSGLTGYGVSLNFTTQTPWRQIDDFPGTARNSVISFSIENVGYVGLGTNALPEAVSKTWYSDIWAFDGTAWSPKTFFQGGDRDAAVSFTIGTDVYIGLGWGGSNNTPVDFWKYNPEANAWDPIANFTGEARGRSVGFSLAGKGYVATGTNINKNDPYEYTPSTNEWTPKASIPDDLSKVEGAVAFTIGNKAYLGLGYIGGKSSTPDDRNDSKAFYEYNGTGWTKIDDFPSNARNSAVAFVIGNKAYVGLGFNGQNYIDFYQFDPAQPSGKKWTRMCDFKGKSRGRAAVFVINNKAYIGLGSHSSEEPALNDFWEYDPSIDY